MSVAPLSLVSTNTILQSIFAILQRVTNRLERSLQSPSLVLSVADARWGTKALCRKETELYAIFFAIYSYIFLAAWNWFVPAGDSGKSLLNKAVISNSSSVLLLSMSAYHDAIACQSVIVDKCKTCPMSPFGGLSGSSLRGSRFEISHEYFLNSSTAPITGLNLSAGEFVTTYLMLCAEGIKRLYDDIAVYIWPLK